MDLFPSWDHRFGVRQKAPKQYAPSQDKILPRTILLWIRLGLDLAVHDFFHGKDFLLDVPINLLPPPPP